MASKGNGGSGGGNTDWSPQDDYPIYLNSETNGDSIDIGVGVITREDSNNRLRQMEEDGWEDIEVDSVSRAIGDDYFIVNQSPERGRSPTSVNSNYKMENNLNLVTKGYGGETIKVSIDRGAIRNLIINEDSGAVSLKDVLSTLHTTLNQDNYMSAFASEEDNGGIHLAYNISPDSEHGNVVSYDRNGAYGNTQIDVALMNDMSKSEFQREIDRS